jgi:GNAT superfamily N-acetyltransferase
MRLRPADPDDLAAIVDVFLACWRVSYRGLLPDATVDGMSDDEATALWGRVLADPDGRVLVAEHDDELVGVTRWTPADTTVQSLYVHPGHQGLGTGGALLDAALADLAAGGAATARLWVFEANAPARAFYTGHGWLPDGGTRTEERFGAPELRLARPLMLRDSRVGAASPRNQQAGTEPPRDRRGDAKPPRDRSGDASRGDAQPAHSSRADA